MRIFWNSNDEWRHFLKVE